MSAQIGYTFEESLVRAQAEKENEFIAAFEAGNYTIEDPMVVVNPYLINPLAALVMFKTEEAVAATVTVIGKEADGTIMHTYPKQTIHILPVLGLYSDYDNKVEVQLYRGYTKTLHIKTEALTENVPGLISMDTTASYLKDQLIFISPALTDYAAGFDYNGDIRWHLTIPTVFDLKRMKNGNIITGSHRLIHKPYYMSGIYEMTMAGKIVKEYSIPGGYHHDHFEMPDGNLLVLTEDLRADTVEDQCVLIDRESGQILRTWDYKHCLTPGDGPSGNYTDEDWFHNNAVWYDEKTNSLTLSGRHVDAMINIDFETGDLNWIIGDPEGWPEEKQKYFFKPVGGGEFDWQYEQHACVITPNGDVMCFDNGHWRSKIKENYLLNKDNFSRGVRYKINTDDMTIEQTWQYGKERGAEFFSQYICNVEYYEDGHYMVHSGGIGYYDGEPAEQMVAMMQDDPKAEARSITVEVLNDEVVLELQVVGNFYRAEKLRLYHDGDNVCLGEGRRLGRMAISEEFETAVPAEESTELIPESYKARVIDEDDRFTFKASCEKGQLVMLQLERGEDVHRYYISTAASDFKAMCVGTFLDSDERAVSLSVNKVGLSGTYELKCIIDDKKYQTGIKIDC